MAKPHRGLFISRISVAVDPGSFRGSSTCGYPVTRISPVQSIQYHDSDKNLGELTARQKFFLRYYLFDESSNAVIKKFKGDVIQGFLRELFLSFHSFSSFFNIYILRKKNFCVIYYGCTSLKYSKNFMCYIIKSKKII